MNRDHNHNNNDSSSASSDFFSPISISFFQQRSSSTNNNNNNGNNSAERRLPPLHDSSWIGARLSPICSFDREGDDDDDDGSDDEEEDAHSTGTIRQDDEQRRHKALHDTLEAAPFLVVNHRDHHHAATERTSLLLGRNSSSEMQQQRGNSKNNLSMIHPLWRSPRLQPQENDSSTGKYFFFWGRRNAAATATAYGTASSNVLTLGNFLVTVSGLNLFAMGIYDVYEWYLLHSLDDGGDDDDVPSSAWSLPWLVPPRDTLLLFGALSPDRNSIGEGGGWRTNNYATYYTGIFSSLLVSTSVVEWLLIAGAWRVLYLSSLSKQKRNRGNSSAAREAAQAEAAVVQPPAWYELGVIYLASAFTGQLWMWTYDTTENLLLGCVAWGTCGVLTAAGMARPLHRFELFGVATMLLLLSLFLRPYASVFGSTGSAFFGWALGACGLFVERAEPVKYPGNGNDLKGMQAISFLGTGFAVLILSLPVLSLAFRLY